MQWVWNRKLLQISEKRDVLHNWAKSALFIVAFDGYNNSELDIICIYAIRRRNQHFRQ